MKPGFIPFSILQDEGRHHVNAFVCFVFSGSRPVSAFPICGSVHHWWDEGRAMLTAKPPSQTLTEVLSVLVLLSSRGQQWVRFSYKKNGTSFETGLAGLMETIVSTAKINHYTICLMSSSGTSTTGSRNYRPSSADGEMSEQSKAAMEKQMIVGCIKQGYLYKRKGSFDAFIRGSGKLSSGVFCIAVVMQT